MALLQYKLTKGGSYQDFPTPSTYKIEYNDLDNNSYRSINSGNLIDSVVSKKWSKIELTYNFKTEEEVESLLPITSANPLYIRGRNPAFGTEYVEMQMRCSKQSIEMLEAQKGWKVSFNLVQKTKVSGQ